MSIAAPIAVMLIGSLPSGVLGSLDQQAPTCDPAINLDAPGIGAALSAYERSRSEKDRHAVPMREGARPMLFESQPLAVAAVNFVRAVEGAERSQRTVLVTCHEYTDAGGQRHEAKSHGPVREIAKGYAMASPEWLQHLHEIIGDAGLDELAQVALDRARAGARATAPFRLPLGLMLPR